MQSAYLVLPACAALSLMLLGLSAGGLRLFMFLAALTTVLSLPLSLLGLCTLDLSAGRITRALRKPLMLAGISELYVHERTGQANITLGPEPHKGIIAQGLGTKDTEDFLSRLAGAHPHITIYRKPMEFARGSLYSFLAPLLFYPFLALSVYTANNSAFAALPMSEITINPASNTLGFSGRELTLGDYSFRPPARLKYSDLQILGPSKEPNSAPREMTLLDIRTGTRAVVLLEGKGVTGLFNYIVFGVENSYNMAEIALGSRWGLVAARARVGYLDGALGTKALRLRGKGGKGATEALAAYGETGGEGYLHLVVKPASAAHDTLHFIATGKALPNESELMDFYASLDLSAKGAQP